MIAAGFLQFFLNTNFFKPALNRFSWMQLILTITVEIDNFEKKSLIAKAN